MQTSVSIRWSRGAMILLPALFAAPCRADDGTKAAATLSATQPGETPATAPAGQPTGSAGEAPRPWLSLGPIPLEIPPLSGELFHIPYSLHGQATTIPMFHGHFTSPYAGPNSFQDKNEFDTSYTGTLFLGARVMPGTEIYFDPEVSAGSGLSGVAGLGDPPNGETPRVSSADPSPSTARLFVRQTFGFGGEQEDITDGQNQIAGKQDISRLTITAGKFAANDIFDANAYAHDPRSQFFNWAFLDDPAWDYPADTKGYTEGLALEFNQKNYTLRYGIFREPNDANGGKLDSRLDKGLAQIAELEYRYQLFDQQGAVRPMAFLNHARMGDYAESVALAPNAPDVTATRSYRFKYGLGINVEQAITSDLGVFGRAGWNDGHTETWAFTEVDRSITLGATLKGTTWARKDDVLGVAGFMSGLSKDHRDYLAAGGLGFELGDGRLRYAPEQGLETYYMIALTRNVFLSFDYQFVDHPGFNADRGPVSIGGFRFHVEF